MIFEFITPNKYYISQRFSNIAFLDYIQLLCNKQTWPFKSVFIALQFLIMKSIKINILANIIFFLIFFRTLKLIVTPRNTIRDPPVGKHCPRIPEENTKQQDSQCPGRHTNPEPLEQ
jgi:hypothetical protein